ncbi:unnamed protein product [Amaranthus hypochondriacus]
MVEHFSPKPTDKDGVAWHGSNRDCFPTKEILNKLYESCEPILAKSVAYLIWSIKVPPRVHLIIWMASLEKLKTGDVLVDRGLLDVNNAMCPFCGINVESNSHIIFTCSFSWSVWMMMLDWWGVSGVLHKCCAAFMLSWESLRPKWCKGKLWKLILGCVIWSLWFERNKLKFDHGVCEAKKLVDTIKIRVGVWATELLGLEASQTTLFAYNLDTACL